MADCDVRKAAMIAAQCETCTIVIPVQITDLSPDGCTALAASEWKADDDFVRLRLACGADINGRLLSCDGHRARIAFYGQVHPRAIADWERRAA